MVALCCAKSLQSCSTLCDPMGYNPPGFSVHGVAWILEWVAISFSTDMVRTLPIPIQQNKTKQQLRIATMTNYSSTPDSSRDCAVASLWVSTTFLQVQLAGPLLGLDVCPRASQLGCPRSLLTFTHRIATLSSGWWMINVLPTSSP